MKQTMEQRRANHAWHGVDALHKITEKNRQDIVTEMKKFPTRIITSGLGQAVTFLLAKNKCQEMLGALSNWLKSEGILDSSDLIADIRTRDSVFLRRVTSESLAYMQWYVRFVEAEFKGD